MASVDRSGRAGTDAAKRLVASFNSQPYDALVRDVLAGRPVKLAVPSRATSPLEDFALYVAHPDDETMYAGGTMARLHESGRKLGVVLMSHGEGGRRLERGPNGAVREVRGEGAHFMAALRDREAGRALAHVDVTPTYLYPPSALADFGWTTSLSGSLAYWNEHLPGGLSGALQHLVADIRARKPGVIVTLDPHNDPQLSGHGHHRAFGTLVDHAARLAANPAFPGGPVHAASELLTLAPADRRPDITVDVNPQRRLAMLEDYYSQFTPKDLTGLARSPVEHFRFGWQAGQSAPNAAASSLLRLLG